MIDWNTFLNIGSFEKISVIYIDNNGGNGTGLKNQIFKDTIIWPPSDNARNLYLNNRIEFNGKNCTLVSSKDRSGNTRILGLYSVDETDINQMKLIKISECGIAHTREQGNPSGFVISRNELKDRFLL